MKEYKWFYETCRALARVAVLLLVRLRVIGLENVPATGPVILVSNHLNWTDIPMVGLRLKRLTHFMAKAELFQKPPISWLVIGLGAFPVRRGEADRQAIKQAEEVLKAGQVLVIFPEGHRSDTHQMIPGLAGAALIAVRSGAPIVPIGIAGSERFRLSHLWPNRTPITLTFGEPFTLSREGRGHTDLQGQLESMMHHIADLLPPQYRGVYGADASGTPSAAVAPAAALEGAPASVQEAETETADRSATSAEAAE